MSKILLENVNAQIKVKKSVFICNMSFVNTKEEALSYINKIRKEHYDATHNCYAYVVDNGKYEHFSDDGEPSGTAGRPMLAVLNGNDMVNVVAIVTRYFGGVLLGTGGLVRAYSDALKEALKTAKTAERLLGIHYVFSVDYTYVGKIKHNISENNIELLEEKYSNDVEIDTIISLDKYDEFTKNLVDMTSGGVKIILDEKINYLKTSSGIKIL